MGLSSSIPVQPQQQRAHIRSSTNMHVQAPYQPPPGYSRELRAELPVATPIRNVQQPARLSQFSLRKKNEGSLFYALKPQVNTIRVRDAHALATRPALSGITYTDKKKLYIVSNNS